MLAATTELRGARDEVEETVLMPTPAGVVGSWTWTEQRGGAWERLPILSQDQYDLPLARPELRSGFLTLDDAAAHSRTDR
ncbi:hypothetical protein SU9_019890 [Streptomyces auratus AGR0001]|uniref:Uncharacterized protein n=1 Tax=Streptomyces auratus AGR0001 TaxID=1160718 RepID=A0A8B1P3U7_9ACTN|nr:hypothetical protein SU9_019890 [Streptomyces auratus AGR0001]